MELHEVLEQLGEVAAVDRDYGPEEVQPDEGAAEFGLLELGIGEGMHVAAFEA